MALLKKQIEGLESANKRKQSNWTNSPQSKIEDNRNLNYAIDNKLWSPKKNTAPFTDVGSFAQALKNKLTTPAPVVDKKKSIAGIHHNPLYSSQTPTTQAQPQSLNAQKTPAVEGEIVKETTPTPVAISALQQKYSDSFKTTEKEIELSKRLEEERTASRLGIEEIEAKPIRTSLLWGQKERALKQSGIRSGSLQEQLALEQSKRMSTQQQLQTQVGWEMQAEQNKRADEKIASTNEEAKNQEDIDFQRKLVLGGYQKIEEPQITQHPNAPEGWGLDPATGRLAKIEEALNEDDIVRLPNGDIYRKPEVDVDVDSKAGTSSMQEYGLAQEEGYTGDFMSFLTAKSNASQNPYDAIKDQLQIKKYMKDIAGDLDYKDKVNLELKMSNDFEKFAQEARQATRSIEIIKSGWSEVESIIEKGEGSLNAPSQAMLVTFQKMLDPTSVVRESEYARSGTGLALKDRIEGIYTKLIRGGAGISAVDLQEFYDMSNTLLQGYQNQMMNYAQRTKSQADGYGLDLEKILTPDVLNMLGNIKTGETTKSNYNSFGLDESYEDMVAEFGQEGVNSIIENLKKKL